MKVFLIAAVSADGFIARSHNQAADWTSREDKKLFVQLTKQAGVMVMGATTYQTIGRALPGRKTVVYTRHPESITDPTVATTDEHPRLLVERLAAEDYREVAICGGAQIYSLFAGLLDEIYLTVEPVVFGNGVSLFAEALSLDLELLESRQLSRDVQLLHYRVRKDPA